jgi:hypothetical protein
MTLYIDTGGVPAAVFSDLYTISWQDGGLGENGSLDPSVFLVTYTETPGMPSTADRLNELVNNDFGIPIVITGLLGGNDPYYQPQPYNITGNGHTYYDNTSGSYVMRVVYDVSDCNGAGIYVYDAQRKHITFPRPVMLYHELSHVYHTLVDPPNTDVAAEIDENVLRGQLQTCLRDVNNPNGACGPGDDCGMTTSTSDCFIVSAASGAPESAEVVRLKQLRDRVIRSTCLGRQLLDAIYRDYYRFSPRIATELRRDLQLREGVLRFAVRPLIAWYSLAEAVSLAPDDAAAREAWCTEAYRACLFDGDPAVVAQAMAYIRMGQAPSADAPLVLAYLAQQAREASRLRFASWAILEPLVRVWTATAAGSGLCGQVRAWLAAAPLEALDTPDIDVLDVELALLAKGPLSGRAERHDTGHRLAAAWPQTRRLLARHDFVDTGERE